MSRDGDGKGLARFASYWRYAISNGTPQSSLRVAAVIGTVLNVINQGDALVGNLPVSWPKIALTYAVPYCVSTYAAVMARLRLERAAKTGEQA